MGLIEILIQIALIGLSSIIGYIIGKKQTREMRGEKGQEEKKQIVDSLLAEIQMNYHILDLEL